MYSVHASAPLRPQHFSKNSSNNFDISKNNIFSANFTKFVHTYDEFMGDFCDKCLKSGKLRSTVAKEIRIIAEFAFAKICEDFLRFLKMSKTENRIDYPVHSHPYS